MLIPRLHQMGEEIVAFTAERVSPRLTDLDSYLAIQGWVLARLSAEMAGNGEYLHQRGGCIHRTARVADSARLVGAVMLGPHTVVKADAIVVGPAVTGDECVVGPTAVVRRSVLWNSCTVERQARVDECLLASGAVARAGAVKCAGICLPGKSARSRLAIGAGAA
jgi:NDP-sugar pyrophosphorylase family protein